VLLMDEPLAAVDAQTRTVLQEELLRIWGQELPARERKTIVYVTHAIEEAIFLADRAVVMTSHPGRIKEVLKIDLPRPRLAPVRLEPRFQELSQHIWELIRDAAYRASLD
jgi:NitT/TauT family transport system ATP-binding protein